MTKLPLRDGTRQTLSSAHQRSHLSGPSRQFRPTFRVAGRETKQCVTPANLLCILANRADRRQHFSVRGSEDLANHSHPTNRTMTAGARPVAILTTLDQILSRAAEPPSVMRASDRILT